MALRQSDKNDLPENAVRLTYDQALSHQMKIFNEWKYKKDVWAIRNYPFVIGAGTVISAMFFNHHFRYKCRLRNLGRAVTYLPAVFVPTFISILDHNKFAVQNVLMNKCLLCTTIKSVLAQMILGLTIPAVLGAAGSYVIAAGYHTIDVPSITQYQKMFALFKKHLFAAKRPIIFLALMNVVLSGSMVYFEHRNFELVQSKLIAEEEEYAKETNLDQI